MGEKDVDAESPAPRNSEYTRRQLKRHRSQFELRMHAVAKKEMMKSRFLIDPRTSRFVPVWDICMLVSLAFTMIFTPYEVGFLRASEFDASHFVFNRIVDLCFMIDIVLTFNMVYQEKELAGGNWVYGRRRIAVNYLTGWFFVDFVSVLPMWILEFAIDDSP